VNGTNPGRVFEPRRRSIGIAWRVTSAVIGGLVVAIAASVCLAVAVPDRRGLGLALGLVLLIPIWTAAMCLGFLAHGSRKLWAVYLTLAAALGAAAWLLRKGG
jgi:hypothetical protein